MFEFDWSIITTLPHTFNLFKKHYHILSYDSHINKFWTRSDYNTPSSLDFEEFVELLDQINILISEEASFDTNLKKRYRNKIITHTSITTTDYFYDKDDLHNHTTGIALLEVEKQLMRDELRTITMS